MTTGQTLDILGAGDRPVPHRFIRREAETDHLAIVLPGLLYSVDLPLLHFPARLLHGRGADVLLVEYEYGGRSGSPAIAGDELARRLREDVLAAASAPLDRRPYDRITLVGKSIGTMAMAAILAADERFRGADCVWLTPLVKEDRLRAVISAHRPRSLFVSGEEDSHYDPVPLAELVDLTGGDSIVIEGGTHSLEVPGRMQATLRGMTQVVEAIELFIFGDVIA